MWNLIESRLSWSLGCIRKSPWENFCRYFYRQKKEKLKDSDSEEKEYVKDEEEMGPYSSPYTLTLINNRIL